jgi:pre-mRNA-splicing helicase BRR2
MEVEPANMGRIAAFYYIKYQTIERFKKRVDNESAIQQRKMRELIEVLAEASEFEGIPIRQGEANILQALTPYLTYPLEGEQLNYNSPSLKSNLLL